MKTWKVTQIRTDKIEASTRREAIDKAVQQYGNRLQADTIEAHEEQKLNRYE